MGLITEEVEVKIHPSNAKRLEGLGYKIPKHKDKRNKMKITFGEVISIKVDDLSDGSDTHVNVECDGCKKSLDISWDLFKSKSKQHDGNYYCYSCAIHLYGNPNSLSSKNSKSYKFSEWCLNNNRNDMLVLWDYELNDCNPNEISYGTNKKYYFKCEQEIHVSELKCIKTITRNPTAEFKCNQCNSIAQYLIDSYGKSALDLYWDYSKNNKSPWAIPKASTQYIFIHCLDSEEHPSYKISCHSFSKGRRCQVCAKNKNKSKLQIKVVTYLQEIGFNVLQEDFCTLKIRNNIQHETMKSGFPLRYDCEIKVNNINIVIEIMGEQHYNLTGFHNLQAKSRNTTPSYELEYQKLKDKYKKDYAINNGYEYIEIPYTSDDINLSWKRILDEAILKIRKNGGE